MKNSRRKYKGVEKKKAKKFITLQIAEGMLSTAYRKKTWSYIKKKHYILIFLTQSRALTLKSSRIGGLCNIFSLFFKKGMSQQGKIASIKSILKKKTKKKKVFISRFPVYLNFEYSFYTYG